MDQITLEYYDNNNTLQTQDFDVLFVYGYEVPYSWRMVPPEALYKLVDGSSRTDYRGFQRIISVDLAPIDADETFIEAFLQAQTKYLVYQGDMVRARKSKTLVLEDPAYQDKWFDDFKQTKKYSFGLVESQIRQQWLPPFPDDGDDMNYIVNKVKIEGTQLSPELFVSNVGKLVTSPQLPVIDLSLYKVAITCNPYQEANIYQVGDAAQDISDSDNIDFYLAVDSIGNPSGDGFYYADIIFSLQLKV